MKIDRRQMKDEARLVMREHRPSIYLIALAFLLIYTLLLLLGRRLISPFIARPLSVLYIKLLYPGWGFADESDYIYQELSRGGLAYVLVLAIACIFTVLSFGFTGVCLSVSRRRAAGFSRLFDGFGFFFKVLWLKIVIGFFIALWSLLLIIPGIIARLRYSQAYYVLLDDPDKSVMSCIRESKRLTAGHKGELFVLSLSFLGWAILGVIPFVSLYTMPYIQVTKANYYNSLSGYQPARVENLEAPRDDSWWS